MSDSMPGGALVGRVALVTGANHGIGAATAVALAERGADVAVSYLRLRDVDDVDQPAAYGEHRRRHGDRTLEGIAAAGRRGHGIEADLSDPEVPARLIEEIEGVLGPVEILVNNASGWRKDSFATEDDAEPVSGASFDAQFHVDARGSALLIAAFAARHRRRGATWGRIVSLTSGGPMGFPGEVSYGAAKAALENYTMAAATELAADGITANVVHPPVTDTGWVTDDVRRFVEESPILVHVATPDDVAQVIAWLCTDAAGLVSGNILRLR
jgi:3-oxoacyl-[acyl-carrier protein] reductase